MYLGTSSRNSRYICLSYRRASRGNLITVAFKQNYLFSNFACSTLMSCAFFARCGDTDTIKFAIGCLLSWKHTSLMAMNNLLRLFHFSRMQKLRIHRSYTSFACLLSWGWTKKPQMKQKCRNTVCQSCVDSPNTWTAHVHVPVLGKRKEPHCSNPWMWLNSSLVKSEMQKLTSTAHGLGSQVQVGAG